MSSQIVPLFLEGSPYERGLQHGQALRPQIHALVAAWKDGLAALTRRSPDQVIRRFLWVTDYIPAIHRWTPDLLDEVRGIAEGSGLDFDTMLAFQLMDELWVNVERLVLERRSRRDRRSIAVRRNTVDRRSGAERRSSDERRSHDDRRSGDDRRTGEDRRSGDDRRSNDDRRAGEDRRRGYDRRPGAGLQGGEDRRMGSDRRSGGDRRRGEDRRAGDGRLSGDDRRSGADRRTGEDRRNGSDRRSGEDRRKGADRRSGYERRTGIDRRSVEDRRSIGDRRGEEKWRREDDRSGVDRRSGEGRRAGDDFRFGYYRCSSDYPYSGYDPRRGAGLLSDQAPRPAVQPDLDEHCTSLGFPPQPGAPTLIAQTMDIESFRDGYQVLLRQCDPAAGLDAFVLSCAGLVGLNGLNRYGVGLCVNTLAQLNHCTDGLPVAFVVRGVLEQTSMDAALDFLRRVPHACGQNYLLAAPNGLVDLECSSDAVVEYRTAAPDGAIWHANLPLASNDYTPHARAEKERLPSQDFGRNSRARCASVARQVGQAASKPRLELVKEILASQDTPEDPICILKDPDASGQTTYTFAGVIFELSLQPELHASFTPGNIESYACFSFDDPASPLSRD